MTIAGTLNATVQNNFVLPILKTIFTFGCSLTQYDSLTCRGMIDYFVDLGAQQLFEMPLGPGNICQNYLRICEIEDLRVLDITQYQNQILKSKPQNVISDNFINEEYERINLFDGSSSRPVIKMLHLADLHLDFKYMAGSAAMCNNIICCREVNGFPDDSKNKAGIYGSYYCDAPKKLMYSMIEYINANIGPDFIVWTGDSTPHTEFEKIGFEEKQTYLTWLNDLFKTNMSSATMYPAPGNHDFSVSNMQDFTKAEPLLEYLQPEWKDWLDDQALEQFKQQGYFAQNLKLKDGRIFENVVLISLNTQSCYLFNFYLWAQRNDPGGQLDWLNKTLIEIEAKNQMAIIFGHVPIGNVDCNYGWSVRFKAIADRFQHIIRFSVYGHVHEEQHYINRAVKSDKPVGVSYLTGSVTPYENINPSFRVFELDVETMLPLRIQTHFMDISKDEPKWELRHQLPEFYQMEDLSPNSFEKLSNRMQNEEELAVKYSQTMSLGAAHKYISKCDEKCRLALACDTKTSLYFDSRDCQKESWFDLVGFVFYWIANPWVNKK
eukprot:403354044